MLAENQDGTRYPVIDNSPFAISGTNSCFRCAPTNHWNNILKGYDTDEYLISNYQTATLRTRNYHKGYTTLFIDDKTLIFDLEATGRGTSAESKLRLWDREYCASDPRSNYIGKLSTSAPPQKFRDSIVPRKLRSAKKKIKNILNKI